MILGLTYADIVFSVFVLVPFVALLVLELIERATHAYRARR